MNCTGILRIPVPVSSTSNQQLKELEMHGMIEKTIYPELPPHVEYSITDDGRSLMPIIRMLEQWGNDFRPKMVRILEKAEMTE